jgi:hypothetical protein
MDCTVDDLEATFYAIENDPITQHREAIAYFTKQIDYLSSTPFTHWTEDAEGRLAKDHTPRMLHVARAAKEQHEIYLRLYQSLSNSAPCGTL